MTNDKGRDQQPYLVVPFSGDRDEPETQWTNRSSHPVAFMLHLDGPRWGAEIQRARNAKHGESGPYIQATAVAYHFHGSNPEFARHVEPGAIEVPFGTVVSIPSQFDRAIQTLDESGTLVMGGLAPQLTRVVGDAPAPVRQHPALDPATSGNGPALVRQPDRRREERIRARVRGAS